MGYPYFSQRLLGARVGWESRQCDMGVVEIVSGASMVWQPRLSNQVGRVNS